MPAEGALGENQAELRQVASFITDYLWSAVVDRGGNVVYRYYSPVVERITGHPPEYYLSGPDAWLNTILPDDRGRLANAAARIVSGQSTEESEEYRIVRPNGTISWVRGNTVARKMGDGTLRLYGSVSDITECKQAEEALKQTRDELERRVAERTVELARSNEELKQQIEQRRRAEAALRQSHEQLQAIYDGMVEGLLITEIATKQILRVNASFTRMLGYSEVELLAMTIADLHTPQDVPEDLRRFQAAAEERVSINEDRPVLRKNGTVFYADITARPILYKEKRCLLALFRDVTDRRRAQAALERQRRTLRHMLRASDHERQLIAYDIHDGLAQQLAAAIMHFNAFDHLKNEKPADADRAFEAGLTLLRQGHMETRRLISGVRPPVLDELGVPAAIAHLIHEPPFDTGPRIDFRSKVRFKRMTPILENAIYRIVQEGLTNACKHSQGNEVRISLVQKGERVRVQIRDWGVGFDPRKIQGNRYGLSGIRERARVLGGKCKLRSQPGVGTTIVVELPIVSREA